MQSVLSRIWTRVAVYISCDDNHYTTGTTSLTISGWAKVGSMNNYSIIKEDHLFDLFTQIFLLDKYLF